MALISCLLGISHQNLVTDRLRSTTTSFYSSEVPRSFSTGIRIEFGIGVAFPMASDGNTQYTEERRGLSCVSVSVCVCLRRSSLILLRPQLAILFRPRDMLPSHGGVLILSVFASVCDCGSVLRAPYLCTNIYFLFCKLLLTGAYFLENC